MRRLGIGLLIGAAAAIVGTLGVLRRQARSEPATAELWPRPDVGTRSYGEVWDFTGREERERRPTIA